MLGNGPHVLGNGPQVFGNGNGPLVLGNGCHLLGIMSHSGLCRIQNYGTVSIMVHLWLCRLVLCHLALCRIQGYVVRHNVAYGIMLHSDLCRSGLWCSV